MAIDFAADLDLAMQGNEHPLQALTWAQVHTVGTASKAIAKAWRTDAVRRGPDGLVALGEDEAEFVIPADQFTSGFSGGASAVIRPGENDTITVSGEVVWEVVSCRLQGAGSFWLVAATRRRTGGSA